jgi:hypothetical protein
VPVAAAAAGPSPAALPATSASRIAFTVVASATGPSSARPLQPVKIVPATAVIPTKPVNVKSLFITFINCDQCADYKSIDGCII